MAESSNLKLYLTNSDDISTLVVDWVQRMAGNNDSSNMAKIDSAIGDLRSEVEIQANDIETLEEAVSKKQEQLIGQEGQFVGFDKDGNPTPKTVNVYDLPVATSTSLGGVQPVSKTDEMTHPVGVSEDGRLWSRNMIPVGGTVGQILSKKSENDYDLEWVDEPQNDEQAEEVLVEHIDMSAWANGEFTITMSDGTTKSGNLTFDDNNRPTSVTIDGHTITFTLPDVE